MLSNSSCFPRNWNCSMSQATWPPSAMIFISFIGAINPFFCSSKSLVSENGSLAFAFLRISIVNFEGALPFGWKCPFNGLAGCGRADSSRSGIWLALFFMAFSFFAGAGVLTADFVAYDVFLERTSDLWQGSKRGICGILWPWQKRPAIPRSALYIIANYRLCLEVLDICCLTLIGHCRKS